MIEKYVNAQELKRLLLRLLVLLGALLIAGLFAMIVVPRLRNANKPKTPTPANPMVGRPGWLDPTEFPPERGREAPPVDTKALLESSPAQLAQGKDLFASNCAPCHGDLGKGDGAAAAAMSPRPRNFTSPKSWTNGYDLPAIFKTLSKGVAGTSMLAFDSLSTADRLALAHYVQSLGTFPHGTGSPQGLQALAKEIAGPGEKTPNKIPVSMAMAKLEKEFNQPPPLVVLPEDHSPGAEVLRRVVIDPPRAALTLVGSPSWRKGPKELAASILPGTQENGFSVSTATLSPSEWRDLQTELVKLLGR